MEYYMSVLNKLKKNSSVKNSSILAESQFFLEKEMIPTNVPVINIALSGRLDGGVSPGLTMWAGESKHFKTAFSLLMAKAYLDAHEDAALLFYDSEFGAPQSYFDSFGIDMNRVLHTPITDVEELKFDIMKQFNELERNDKVCVIIDSVGNLASRKEVDDALNAKSVADMTRAKSLKSLFRMVTPYLVMKNIPLIVVNHTYKEIGLYPKDIVGGGTGSYYSSDNIFIVGRQQDKEGTELVGHNFIINVEKSRYVREKSKIPVSVSFESGISKWSGLMDIAITGGFVVKPSNGWYSKVDIETGEVEEKKYRLKETSNGEFWNPILQNPKFAQYIKQRYMIASSEIFTEE